MDFSVHYLPVYKPSQEESQNPKLFAENVQREMAQYLGVPATNHTIQEKLIYHNQILSGKLPWNQQVIEITRKKKQ